MSLDNVYKLVEFDKYCEKCEYKSTDEGDEPCNECLTNTVNLYSHKPVNFKERG